MFKDDLQSVNFYAARPGAGGRKDNGQGRADGRQAVRLGEERDAGNAGWDVRASREHGQG